MDMKKAMKVALDLEKKGNKLYATHATKTKNPAVKKVFEYLAQQEIHHIKEIEKYITKNDAKLITLGGDKPTQTKKFFNMKVKAFEKKLDLTKSDIKAYETGMHMETKAYSFYKKILKTTKDQKTKKFLEFLMNQENAHYVFLKNAYEYTKNPVAYNAHEEQWMFEG